MLFTWGGSSNCSDIGDVRSKSSSSTGPPPPGDHHCISDFFLIPTPGGMLFTWGGCSNWSDPGDVRGRSSPGDHHRGCLGTGDKEGRLLPTRVRGELEQKEVVQASVMSGEACAGCIGGRAIRSPVSYCHQR